MNTDRKATINRNLDQSFPYGNAYSPSAADLDFSFLEEDELSDEQFALKKLYQGISLNHQYQQKLQALLNSIQAKIEKNNTKLEKVNEIIAFKNKRNKIQLKKKQIELYKYEEPKLPPESFRMYERIRQSKGKKNFHNLYKSLIEDSSSEGEDQEDKATWQNYEEEKAFIEDTQERQGNIKEIKIKKEQEAKPGRKKNSGKKSSNAKGSKNTKMEIEERDTFNKYKSEGKDREDDDENELDYEDELEMDSEDEMRSIKRRGDKLGIDSFLVEYKGKDPREIDWLSLARKVNSRLISKENTPIVTPIDLYRRFIADEVQQKRSQWGQEEDRALLNAVKLHGTNNWKQVANHVEGKNTYLCFQRWAKFVNPDISKGRWNLEEDIKLCLGVEYFKVGNWIAIAGLFRNRTDVQCRERWCNILDPSLNGKEWTKQEDEILLLAVIRYGKKWAQVSRMLKNRTDNQCWRRFKILSKKPKTPAEKNKWESIGIYQAKINFKEPFKVERKKVKRDGIRKEEENKESPLKGNHKEDYTAQDTNDKKKDSVENEVIQEIQIKKDTSGNEDI